MSETHISAAFAMALAEELERMGADDAPRDAEALLSAFTVRLLDIAEDRIEKPSRAATATHGSASTNHAAAP